MPNRQDRRIHHRSRPHAFQGTQDTGQNTEVRGQDTLFCRCAEHVDVENKLFNKNDQKLNKNQKIEKIRKVVNELRDEFGIASIVDIVLSHISSNSPIVYDHPEICYTIENYPHLKIGYRFDDLLHKYIDDCIENNYPENLGVFNTPSDVERFIENFKHKYMIPGEFWLYYVIDINKHKEMYAEYERMHPEIERQGDADNVTLAKRIQQFVHVNGTYEKNHITIDIEKAYPFIPNIDRFVAALDVLNVDYYKNYDADLDAAIANCKNVLNYKCFDPNGPQNKKVTKEDHILPFYFQVIDGKNSKGEDVHVVAAHHGWIYGGDPFVDFVGDKNSKVYIRREAIVWEDSLKLNYGNTYEGNEYIWDHMAEYALFNARIFDGFRLDNCHSVPLEALEYIMAKAREYNPNLVVLAELFADNQEAIKSYVVRCGIHGLVREASRGRYPEGLKNVTYESGWFRPVGEIYEESVYDKMPAEIQPIDGWTYDLTHDNEPEEGNRNPNDALATSAAVAMTIGCTGSVRGYDELIPYRICCVQEQRLYRTLNWNGMESIGISKGKKMLNELHERMAIEGYTEFYAETNGDIVSLTRRNPKTNRSIVMYVHTSFRGNNSQNPWTTTYSIPDYKLHKFLFFGTLQTSSCDPELRNAPELIGRQCDCFITEDYNTIASRVSIENKNNYVELNMRSFPNGSIVCIELELINNPKIEWNIPQVELSQQEINAMLYQAPEEIQVPKFQIADNENLIFVGLGGIKPLLKNDLGLPLYDKLRNGVLEYLIPYIVQNCKTNALGYYIEEKLKEMIHYPRFLIPKYFAAFINKVYDSLLKNGTFESQLRLTATQFYIDCKGTPLIKENLIPQHLNISSESLCAGFTHFNTGYMRNWGRDTFISLRGLLLQNGRYNEAKNTIRGYFCSMRHGLIPNLLDGGDHSRFNARDATWFCLSAVVDYCTMAPNGKELLNETIYRLNNPNVDTTRINKNQKVVMTVAECMQEILESHANGIHFREWNAGPQIDSVMTSEGFNIDIWTNLSTGLISGGNEWNCGT